MSEGKEIKFYGAPWCPDCKKAKHLLDRHGCTYEYIDIEKTEGAQEHITELNKGKRVIPTIEINGTFYGMQRPDAFAAWADAVPRDFVFAVKAPRFITHMKRLRDIEAPLANFIASGLLRLGHRNTEGIISCSPLGRVQYRWMRERPVRS